MAKTATKRADGLYQVNVYDGLDPATGKRRYKSFYAKTAKEARRKADEYRFTGVISSASPLSDWIRQWTQVHGEDLYARKLDDALGVMPLQRIRQIDVQRYAKTLEPMSYSTVRTARARTRRIFADAVRNELIRKDPTDGVEWKWAHKGTHRALELWEQRLILDHWREHRCGLWAVIMLMAGLRRGELLALRWEDIDLDAGVIHVKRAFAREGNRGYEKAPKSEAGERDVPLMPQLREILEEVSPGQSGLIVGREPTDSMLRRGWAGYNLAMERILNGEPPAQPGRRPKSDPDRKIFSVRCHDLRHTFCTILYKAGIGLKDAQYIMGHADAAMTMEIYTHMDQETKKTAQQKLGTYII